MMGVLQQAAIASLAVVLLAACDGGTAERQATSPVRSADVRPRPPTPPAAPAGKIDLTRLHHVQFSFRALDSLMHYPQPTTPAAMTKLAEKIASLAASINRYAPEGEVRDAALQSLRRIEHRIHQGLVIWSEERTLATARHRWIEIRERHFWPAEEMHTADPGLEAAQEIRDPDDEFNLFELLRRGEEAWGMVESLLDDMGSLPEDERYIAFYKRSYRYNGEFGEWYRQRPLRVPRQGPLIVRRAWNALEVAQTGVIQLMALPWARTFEEYVPAGLQGRAERVRQVREELEAWFDRISGTAY